MEQTIAQRALELLEPIPKESWIKGSFTDSRGKCCLLGHYERLTSSNPDDYSYDNCNDWDKNSMYGSDLRIKSEQFLREKHNHLGSGADVNNYSNVNGYNEPGIKDRCIHLLKDMIKHGY